MGDTWGYHLAYRAYEPTKSLGPKLQPERVVSIVFS